MATFMQPSEAVHFSMVVASSTLSQTTSSLNNHLTNSVQTQVNICLVVHIYHVMLTNFTVSVVFLYGVVFGEAYPSHPFDAFRRG